MFYEVCNAVININEIAGIIPGAYNTQTLIILKNGKEISVNESFYNFCGKLEKSANAVSFPYIKVEDVEEVYGMNRFRKELEIRSMIIEYIVEHGYPPSVREIAEGVNLKSISTVSDYLRVMTSKGMLETDHPEGSARAIRVPGYIYVKK